MRNALLFAVFALFQIVTQGARGQSAPRPGFDTYIFGGNWQVVGDTSFASTMRSIGLNSWHIGADSIAAISAATWAKNAGGTTIIAPFNKLSYYTVAQMMVYRCAHKSATYFSTSDTAQFTFFSDAGHMVGKDSVPLHFTNPRWDWYDSAQATPTNHLVLEHNDYQSTWIIHTDGNNKLHVGAKLHVEGSADSTREAIDIDLYKVTGSTETLMHRFVLTEAQCVNGADPNADFVVVANDSIVTLDSNFSLEVKVRSAGKVNTWLQWVAVWDNIANTFLVADELGGAPGNTTDRAWPILQTFLTDYNATYASAYAGKVPDYYYGADEVPLQNALAFYWMQKQISNYNVGKSGTSVLGNLITETSAASNDEKWLAMAQLGNHWPGVAAFESQRVPWVDYRSQATDVSSIPYAAGYFDDTAVTIHNIWNKEPNWYEDGSGGFCQASLHGMLESCNRAADAVLRFPTGALSAKQWWADFFFKGQIRPGDSLHHAPEDSNRGRFWAGVAGNDGQFACEPYAEQISASVGTAFCFGAKGFLFWTPRDLHNADSSAWYTYMSGFVDDHGMDTSDYVYGTNDKPISSPVDSIPLPMFYKRNSNWTKSFSSFLRGPAQELYDKEWYGGWGRCDYLADSDVVDSFPRATVGIAADVKAGDTSEALVQKGEETCFRYQLHEEPVDATPGMVIAVDTVRVSSSTAPTRLRDYRWLASGYWRDSASTMEKRTHWLAVTNLHTDIRDLYGQWHGPYNAQPFTGPGASVMRGTRIIGMKLNLDPTRFYHVVFLDSTGFDTIMVGSGTISAVYQPGQTRIFRIDPPCQLLRVANADEGSTAFNNATHLTRNDSTMMAVYERGDSIFLNITDNCAFLTGDSTESTASQEVLIEPGGPVFNAYDAFPCITGPGSIITSHYLKTVCRNPAIAMHRSFHNQYLVVYEENIVVKTGQLPMYRSIKQLRGCFVDPQGTKSGTIVFAGIGDVKQDTGFRATVSICSIDSGWVVAWGDTPHVRVRVIGRSSASFGASTILQLTDSVPGIAQFPSIAWGTDTIAASPYKSRVHVVWQHPDSAGHGQIWHQVIEADNVSSGCPGVSKDDVLYPTEVVSVWGNGSCDNAMPCVSVDGTGSNTSASPNRAHIVWHEWFLDSSWNRVCYREWYKPKSMGVLTEFASGSQGFFEPHVYISPLDPSYSTLMLAWQTSKDSMIVYLPDEFVSTLNPLHAMPYLGKHPTLSYEPLVTLPSSVPSYNDPSYPTPATIFQTPGPNREVRVATSSSLDPTQRIMPGIFAVNGVVAHAKVYNPLAMGCVLVHTSVSLTGNPTGTNNTAPVLPASYFALPDRNGMNEDTIVHSSMMILHLGVALGVNRQITALDTTELGALIAGGRTVRILVELLDSATHSVLATIDSFVVRHANDTVRRAGIIWYNPASDQVGFPVYVRARIVADSSVTRWEVHSMLLFNVPDTANAGFFAKQLLHDYGRAGVLPVGINPIDLISSPNPFTNHIRFIYSVPVENSEEVTEVRIFDVLGRDVSTLVSETKPAGRYAIEFNATELQAGSYVVAVHEKNNMQSRMIVRVK